MVNLSLNDLCDYTDWERQKWRGWLEQRGADVLKLSAGPHGDGRFQTVGDVVRHIFSAEMRYMDRLSGRPITDTAAIPSDSIEALFQLGQQSRKAFREFAETFPAAEWDVPQEFTLGNSGFRMTPRKIAVHVLLHEIRHWAQIATLFRMNGLALGEFHDILFSPALGEL
jgi:uncharacterized damage-inducible protein DinB